MIRRFGFMTMAALLISSAGIEAKAGLVLGNIPPTYTSPTYNTNGQVAIGSGGNYGVEFTATLTGETVTSATLILTLGSGATPVVGIYTSATPTAGSLVGAFTDSSLSTGTAVSNTFTGSATLVGGQQYFLILSTPTSSAALDWVATSTAANPAGLVPTGPGAVYEAAGTGSGYALGNTKPSFELDSASTVVPEPSSLILAGLGGAMVLGFRRLRGRSAPDA